MFLDHSRTPGNSAPGCPAGQRGRWPRPRPGQGSLAAFAVGIALALGPANPAASPAPHRAADTLQVGVADEVAVADSAAGEAPAPLPAVTAPADFTDLGAWLAYRRDAHRSALPDEARIFYHRGLAAHHAGDHPEATRFLRGAAELDPSFVAPHLTLAGWSLTRDPTQALLRYAVVLDRMRRSFLLQIELAANLLFFTIHGLFLALLGAGLVIVALRQAQLRHMWHERLARHVSPASARVWAWLVLLVPFAAGLGLALPVVVFLGMLWPLLRGRERLAFVGLTLMLVAAPVTVRALGWLAIPLHEDQAPFYGTASLPDEAWSASRQAEIERLAYRHPDDPFLQFALGWAARQGGDLATAEAAYRRTLRLWPRDARTENNLANVLVAQGHTTPAIELYRAAMSNDAGNAAAPLNLSMVYTKNFEYRAASEAAARASALDFELVKDQQALVTSDGVLPTADQWIAPETFWSALVESSPPLAAAPALPPVWRGRVETAGPLSAALALVLAVAGVGIGMRWQRSVPLRPCGNCGRVVCRRCSQRRRELALCPSCAQQEARAESHEFARVLLRRLRVRRERARRVAHTSLALLLPGFGLLACQRLFRPVLLIGASALLAAGWFGVAPPFSYHPWPGHGEIALPAVLTVAAWLLIYACSILGYLARASRTQDPPAVVTAPLPSRPHSAGSVTARAA